MELGRSVYLSSFEGQCAALERDTGDASLVFLSLHISEEFSPEYCARAQQVCRWLGERGFRIIADVSTRTVRQFRQPDLVRLGEELGLWALRIDYGFSPEEITALAERFPIVLNASTTTPEAARSIAGHGAVKVMAMHNFYPRPETGLDDDYFRESTRMLREAGLEVLAFVPGDTDLRGPIGAGLPTLERHRGVPPSACFTDLVVNFGLENIFAGDPGLSEREAGRIRRFCREGVIELPTRLEEPYRGLYGKVFTCRVDSPAWMVRFAEARKYAGRGEEVQPYNCLPRKAGSITLDNRNYGRYTGELQLLRKELPADERVNVIGQVREDYLLLAQCIRRGAAFALAPD